MSFLLDQYPVVPSFDDWEFPHGRLPVSWPETIPPADERRRWPETIPPADERRRCGVTNFSYPLEEAHLIPRKETNWFLRNDMGRYNFTGAFPLINDPANLLPLKTDTHDIFDDRQFVIIPKAAGAGAAGVGASVAVGVGTGAEGSTGAGIDAHLPLPFVTHMLGRDSAEFWPTHHNILVRSLHTHASPYLFARFAWAILFHVKRFILSGAGRVIVLQVTLDNKKTAYQAKLLTGKELMKSYGGGGSQSATPIKGKRPAGAMDEEDSVGLSSEDEYIDDMWDVVDNQEGKRKRQRQQISSEETVPSLPPDVEADLREILLQGMAEQQVSQEVEKAQEAQEVWDTQEGSHEMTMTLRLNQR
jgi:hypothetical protein